MQKNDLNVESELPDYSGVRIETKDLILKKAVFSDWKAIYENLQCHAESARYMTWEITTSEEDAMARMQRTLQFQKSHKYALYIYEKASGEAIGFAGMQETEPGEYEEIGIAIGPAFVGKGYGTQILNALVEEAKRCGANAFVAACRTENITSHNLQMKCGFHFTHFEDRVDPRNGEPYVLEFNLKVL